METYRGPVCVFRVVQKEGDIVLCEGVSEKNGREVTIYEVFKVRKREGRCPSGSIIKGDCPPVTEEFGITARCHLHPEKAVESFKEFCEKNKT